MKCCGRPKPKPRSRLNLAKVFGPYSETNA
jgi:hypothetical protein